MQVVCGDGRSRRPRRRLLRSALTEATVRLTLSVQLTDSDDGAAVTVRRQSQLLHTLDNVVDAMQTAAAERRLLPVGGDVTDVRELTRTWEPVVCRDGEVRDEHDLSVCCKFSLSHLSHCSLCPQTMHRIGLVWLTGAVVCLCAAPRVQLFAIAGNG